MRDHGTHQDTFAQQCTMGYCLSHARQVLPTLQGLHLFSSFFLLADLSCQAITLFVSTADQRYGPITTIRRNGRVVKHIPWTVFAITETDWERVKQVCDILAVITS
jgi:hypothetical protein